MFPTEALYLTKFHINSNLLAVNWFLIVLMANLILAADVNMSIPAYFSTMVLFNQCARQPNLHSLSQVELTNIFKVK